MIPFHARRWRVLATSLFLVSTVLPAAAAPVAAAGTISIVGFGDPYTQNFDTLAASATSGVVPAGWDFSEAGTNANTIYSAGTGSGNAGDTYSFGAAGSSERAFGGLLSGSLAPTIGAALANDTGGTITSLEISYTGEMWRAGATNRGTADRLDFQYSTDATSLTTGTWNHVDALDFNSPNLAAAAGALDGSATGNRSAVGSTLTDLSVPNGGTIWIRWTDFNISGSDDGLAIDDVSITADGEFPPEAAPAVTSTSPADGATGVPAATNLTVTFSEAVNVTPAAFALTCTSSGSVTLTVSGGPTSFTLDPGQDLSDGESCTLTIAAAAVTDQDANDPPDTMAADVTVVFTPVNVCQQAYTPAYDIQGSGAAAAVTGTVTTQGVVVGDYERPSGSTQMRGFYLQDLTGDGNPATSDAIFVFNGNDNEVSVGDVVRVTGTAGEFQSQTQVGAFSTGIVACGTGTVAPTDVTLPLDSATSLERYEGMLVRLPQTMYVTEHFQLGRFGQVVVSSGERLRQPTAVVEPGAPALALQAENNLDRIIIDDGDNSQNADPIQFGRDELPLSASNTLRGGDTATGTVGVMSYTWAGNSASGNAFRVRPIGALDGYVRFEATNPRPTSGPDVGGSIRIVGMNLLNYYNTWDGIPDNVDDCTAGVGGEPEDCRGAETQAEFDRQWPKTVAAIVALDAAVIGLNELENDGYGPDSSIADLVNRLNAATAPGTYAFIDADAGTGQVNALGDDAIRVGMIYRPGVVTPVGRTAALNTTDFTWAGDSAMRNRPSLAQAFEVNATGARLVVDVNHLKSKSTTDPCDLPDAGDGQGSCNEVRTTAAQVLVAWLAGDPTGAGDADVIMVGDYNSYAMEDPIDAIVAGGFSNLAADLLGPAAYSYVFDGQWGYLDYAFASASLGAQVTGVAQWHINADEPSVLDYNVNFKSPGQLTSLFAADAFRMSDHDPVVVGLDLDPEPQSDRPNTGSGWILSGAGAYPAAPAATGKAQFAFDVKYSRHGVLGGTASFAFGAGGFSFEATSFDSLVTSASLATVRGTGTVNGAGAYPFLLSALDGTPDRFRLQVWTTGGAVVYDNGMLQPLGGGSIMVRPAR